MKFAAHSPPLISLAATFAHAQTNNNIPQVQHVIIVIQENRTPDNLFQTDQTLINNGAHIASQGLCLTTNPKNQVQVQLGPAPLGTCWDTYHKHNPDWITMWDNGALDGACQVQVDDTDQITKQKCQVGPPPCTNTNFATCPAMTYVENTL
jgi:hypothetical protein